MVVVDLRGGLARVSSQDVTGVLDEVRFPRRTRPVTDATWTALRNHTTNTDDLIALARSADERGRYIHTEALYRAAGRPGRAALARRSGWAGSRAGRPRWRRLTGTPPPDTRTRCASVRAGQSLRAGGGTPASVDAPSKTTRCARRRRVWRPA